MAQVDMKGDAPIGAIVPFFGAVTAKLMESGWLVCNGATLQQSEWPDLHAAIGQAFGYQVKESDFCLPDLQGVLLRTVDAGAGRQATVHDQPIELLVRGGHPFAARLSCRNGLYVHQNSIPIWRNRCPAGRIAAALPPLILDSPAA